MAKSTLPPELTAMFREELRETVQLISAALREIESGAAPERAQALAQDVKRRFHNIKGAANSLAIVEVAKVAHAAETFMLRSGGRGALSEEVLEGLFRATAWLQDAAGVDDADPSQILESLGASLPPPPPAPVPAPGPSHLPTLGEAVTLVAPDTATRIDVPPGGSPGRGGADEVVRVSGALLEKVLSPLTSLVVSRTEGRFRGDRLQQLSERAASLSQRAGTGVLDLEDVAELRELASELGRETELARQDSRHMGQALSVLEDQIHGMRLVSLGSLENALALAVRDAALRTKKSIDLSVRAGRVQVDRRVLEALRSPLIHLVRNAVDHGIESPAAREAAGKSPRGTVSLRVRPRGELVDVVLEDDGAGVDVERVKELAVARGMIPAGDADTLGSEEILALLARPGFSTRARADELSGRGVGMDVVYRAVRELGGSVALDSAPGQFTRFTLTVPVSMLTTRVLFVRADTRPFALPLSGVVGTARVSATDFFNLDGKACVNVGSEPAMVRRLVGEPDNSAAPDAKVPAVLVGTSQGNVALIVDEVLGEEEVVIRPLGPPVRHVPGVVGTTLAESGAVVVVLSSSEVLELGTAPRTKGPKKQRDHMRGNILVVDDSITTRTLERHILERRGYSVRLASDGQEALGMLRAHRFDLVVADVEMPRLNGIEMVRAIRSDPAFEGLPVILVTSRDAEDDRRRGLAAGAQAYITKGRFDQDVLVETIRGLLEGKN
jgi:two-component system chemotaxis sensor kinase CheA